MSYGTLNGTTKEIPENGDIQEIEEEEEEEEIIHLEYFDEALQVHLLKSLNRMRKSRHFCDVILHVGNTEVHAHRSVLASISPYLFELFTTDQDQKRTENVITYRLNGGFDTTALQILIDYAYTGKLRVHYNNVKAVFSSANNLKMERVTRICAQHLIKHLSAENCVEIRSLPGIARNKEFIQQVDTFIAKEFAEISKSSTVLNLYCARIEVLNQSREEMSLVNENSLCRLVLEWIRRQISDEHLLISDLSEKTFMLYLALDNSLQDCSSLPSGDISDTEMVQDYKKLSLKDKQGVSKPKRKVLGQPSKPRVLIYNREIGEELDNEMEPDWNLIATTAVSEHSFLGLVTLAGKLSTLSIQLKLNTPSTPSPVQTPDASRSASEDKPDLYCAVANMLCHRCAHGCGNYNNTLIVCGGYDRTECLRSAEQYIPETNTWKNLPPMRESRGRFKIAVLDDKIYAIGGSNGTTELDSVEMLDFSVGKWVKLPRMPLARSNLGVCTLDKKIYCIGGWNGQVGIKQCHVYNPETAAWTSIASLNAGRYQAGVTAYNNLVYAIGGSDAWNCLSSVEYYNPVDNTWHLSKPIITARRGCGLTVFNNKMYVIGGSDGSHSLNTTEIFDDETQTWTFGPAMTTSRANMEVAVVGDRLYAVGGFSGKTFLNTIEYLDLNSNEWTTFVPKGTCEFLNRRKPRSRKNSRKSMSEDKKSLNSPSTPSDIMENPMVSHAIQLSMEEAVIDNS
ncbi:influenza virus NS1A-binding protein-like isoform X1 [Diabrotica virgifera virgifera]|uniref:BTB domain-containing protein n=2 Tax=Diabrotica virgifera virgifera TaxID=50390 RepID=A0ABM5KIT3_DIAVI|nr:influenza virus NS1A-binding protein-like isoform X1 [Diabrotica virgifera virgifera]XP_050510121.1 influenza virus NS1A-binding protein-like isoform X1 [Diabrotica virgifera virgifera]XP_050510122.1 influenza virus NS1A-binding protein-like isoform X1 [Diabrotica virgifera virgifera]